MVRVCGSKEDAEDALAEALLRAYKASDELRSEEAFRAWLVQIGRRVCLRLRQRDKVTGLMQLAELDVDSISDEPTAEEEANSKVLQGCLTGAVEALPEIYREVYVLRDIEGLSAPEVSERLGISIAAIKSRLHRARALVREAIDGSVCAQGWN